MKSNKQGIALVLLSTIAFGCMGVFAKVVYQAGMTPLNLMTLRFACASAFFALWLAVSGQSFRVSLSTAALYLVLGVLYFTFGLSYFLSLAHTDASITALVFATYPVMVLIGRARKEKVGAKQAALIGLSLAALYFLVSPAPGSVLSWQGVLLALLGAGLYAIYTVLLDHPLLKEQNSALNSFYIVLFASLANALVAVPSGQLQVNGWSLGVWGAVLGLALISTNLAVLTFARGVTLIGPTLSAVLSNFEALAAVGFAVLFLGETLSLLQAAAAAVLILSLTGVSLLGEAPKKASIHQDVPSSL